MTITKQIVKKYHRYTTVTILDGVKINLTLPRNLYKEKELSNTYKKSNSHFEILMYIYNFLLQFPVYSSEQLIFLKLVQSISIPKIV